MNNINSSGYFIGGIISDGGSGTIDITAGQGFIRTTADDNAPILSFAWDAIVGLSIPDDTTRYVFVDDEGVVSLNASEFVEAQDKIMIGVVTDEGGVISHAFNLGVRLQEGIGQMGRYIRRVDDVVRDKRKGGLLFGQSGNANRDVTLTQGSLWWGRTEYPIPNFDTSGADTFDTYITTGQAATGVSQWPNLQFDNGSALETMINNRWAVLWFYIEPDGHIVMLYGRDQYVTEGQAEDELVPSTSIPNRLSAASVLAAKWIFQKGEDIATKIESAFAIAFSSSGVTDHSNLANLPWSVAGHTMDADLDMGTNNITNVGLVDGIDIATDVAANTTHSSSDGKDHSDVVLNNAHRTDNSQAHSDYLKNNANDTTSGTITAAGFITGGTVSALDVVVGETGGFFAGMEEGETKTVWVSATSGGATTTPLLFKKAIANADSIFVAISSPF